MRWATLLLRPSMSRIPRGACVLRHRATHLCPIRLHQACYRLRIIYDIIIYVVIIHYVGDVLSLVWSTPSCLCFSLVRW